VSRVVWSPERGWHDDGATMRPVVDDRARITFVPVTSLVPGDDSAPVRNDHQPTTQQETHDMEDMSGEARELSLYIDNEPHLYRWTLNVHATLARHWVRGGYSADAAPRAFARLVASAAREYEREHGSAFGPRIFAKRDRDQVCEAMARDFAAIARQREIWSDLGDKAAAILAKGTA